jgi:hypothetical protein
MKVLSLHPLAHRPAAASDPGPGTTVSLLLGRAGIAPNIVQHNNTHHTQEG